jgi:hypothetical protein
MKSLLLAVALLAQAGTRQAGTGLVTGRIVSPDGMPAPGVRVAAMVAREAGPQTEETLAGIAVTDNDGIYRLENLEAGRYYVRAGLIDHPTYFPGVTSLGQARVISLDRAATVSGIDFSILRGVGVRVSGRIVWDPRRPLASAAPAVLLARGATDFAETRPNADGSFEFLKVPPGTYSVVVRGAASVRGIRVENQDIAGIALVVPARLEVTVRLVVEGTERPNSAIDLLFVGSARQGVRRELLPDRQIKVLLHEDTYRVNPDTVPAGYVIRAITYGATDLLKQPLVLSQTTRPAEIVVRLAAK